MRGTETLNSASESIARSTRVAVETGEFIISLKYSQSSRKRPPQEFKKVVATRAGCLRE